MARRSRRDYYEFIYYKPSRPQEVKGGIKAQTKRGAFGSTWWAKRWIEVLESFRIGARLGRGRSYARKGQVLSINIEKGQIKAQVQGSRSKPYSITVQVKMLSETDWETIIGALADQPIFAAKLLAGEMPYEIEMVFEAAGVSLFPTKYNELKTDCSCPDWSNPCKHIAAVFYLLGEEFDRDPFLIFKMRGITREALIAQLAQSTSSPESPEMIEPESSPEPLKTDATLFWQGRELLDDLFGEVDIPRVSAALPKRLGNFPMWRGNDHFLDALESMYESAAPVGMNTFLGEGY